jgi:hypothetical protein
MAVEPWQWGDPVPAGFIPQHRGAGWLLVPKLSASQSKPQPKAPTKSRERATLDRLEGERETLKQQVAQRERLDALKSENATLRAAVDKQERRAAGLAGHFARSLGGEANVAAANAVDAAPRRKGIRFGNSGIRALGKKK